MTSPIRRFIDADLLDLPDPLPEPAVMVLAHVVAAVRLLHVADRHGACTAGDGLWPCLTEQAIRVHLCPPDPTVSGQ